MSSSLQPQGLQRARLPCPSRSPAVCPSSCRFNLWCSPLISSSAAPSFAFHLSTAFPFGNLLRTWSLLDPRPFWRLFLVRSILTKLRYVRRGLMIVPVRVVWLSRRDCRSVASGRWWLHKHPARHRSGNAGPSASERKEHAGGGVRLGRTCAHARRPGGNLFQWSDFSLCPRRQEKRLDHLSDMGGGWGP